MIVVSWRRNQAPRDHAASQPVQVTRTGEKPQAESKGFEDTQTIGGRLVSRIRAKRVVAYTSNWNTLEGVALTIYRPNGLTYELLCPQAQFNSETKHAEAKGGVSVTSSDGVVIKTAEINFDGNRLTNHIPVEFKIDRWTGNGGALDLDVENETVRLFDKITATMAPEKPAEAPMNLASQEGVFRRKENDVTFTQQVNGNRVDITLARAADATGATGTGLLAAVLFDAIAPGSVTLTVSGAATGPGGAAMGLRFAPVIVNVQ